MANKEKKQPKVVVVKKNDHKKGLKTGQTVEEPKKWPKVLKRVPMNRDVRIKDLPPQPVFTSDQEKQQFLDKLREATANSDWSKEFKQAGKDDVVQIEFSGLGDGRVTTVTDGMGGMDELLTPGESQRLAAAMNDDVANVNKTFTIPGQVTDDPKFVLPTPAKESSAIVDENDIPEYVLAAFLHPVQGFTLESTIEIGCTVRIVYRRDPEFFEASIRIGQFRKIGEQMEINSLVTKDGAKYAVNGIFTLDTMNGGKQPRTLKLYKYLKEKLGLN